MSGMLKAAAFATVLAACADGVGPEHPDPTTPVASTVTTTVGDTPVVARGGAMVVHVDDPTAIGLDGNASAGYVVEPYELARWPNTISVDYWVRAQIAGMGSYDIVTSKGIASGLVWSADLAHVAILPARYELAGDTFALAANRTDVQVALYAADGTRLVDGTLAIDGTQTAWDTARLMSDTFNVEGDSLPARTFTIPIVAAAERIEEVRDGNRVCFHAYAGTTEVVTAMTIEGGTIDPRATNCATGALRASL
jgi:hypothetical protein